VALEEDTGGIQQHQAGQQAQEELSLVGVFRQHLIGLCGHQVFQPPEIMFDPTLPLPCADQTWRSDIGRPAEQIVALPAWRLDDDPSDQTIAAAGGGQSGRADARPLRAIVPPPSARVSKARPCTHRPSGRWNTYEVFPSTTSLPCCTDSTWLLKAVLPNPSSATTSGCGSPTPRRYSP
jgi:hypothetical protein